MIMMNGDEVLSVYEDVAVITRQMLDAARAGDWEQLTALESRCSGHIDRLRSEGTPVPAGAARERKIEIIRQILEDDRQIRAITEPWMEHLSKLIYSVGTERRLVQAYGVHQTG